MPRDINLPDRSLVSTYTGHNAPDPLQVPWIIKLGWSPSGDLISSIGSQGKGAVHVWDPFTGKLAFAYGKQKGYHSWAVNDRKIPVSLGGIAWSPRGDRIASSSWNGTVHVFGMHRSLTGGRTDLIYERPERDGTGAVAWSPDGKLIACAGKSSFFTAVDVWDPLTGKIRWVWEGPQGMNGKTALAWSPDGRRLAMSNYGSVFLFDSISGKRSSVLKSEVSSQPSTKHSSGTKDISWSPDGRHLAIVGSFLQIWDTIAGALLLRYPRTEEDGLLNAVAWSPTGGRLASSSARDVHIWDALNASELARYSHRGVFTLDWSPDGTYLASGGQDCIIQVRLVV
jgi:WD40 repeat protein